MHGKFWLCASNVETMSLCNSVIKCYNTIVVMPHTFQVARVGIRGSRSEVKRGRHISAHRSHLALAVRASQSQVSSSSGLLLKIDLMVYNTFTRPTFVRTTDDNFTEFRSRADVSVSSV